MSSPVEPQSDWNAPPASGAPKRHVCITYSLEDQEWQEKLAVQLEVLENFGVLEPWTDQGAYGVIEIGEMRRQMRDAMDRAAVVILLISANYLKSPFVRDEEIPQLMRQKSEEGVRVIPLIVRPCPWQRVPWLKETTPSPKDGIPLSTLSEAQAEIELATLATEIADIVAPDQL